MTYLLSTLGCLGISSIYHLFYCHSRTFDKVLTTADYIGPYFVIFLILCSPHTHTVMLAASQPATVAAVPAASRLSVRAGIAQLVVVSFYPPLFFGFSCWPNYRLLYMSAITVLGLVGLLGPLFSAFHLPRYRCITISLQTRLNRNYL
jgi:predicted membrane channel-forming protein YqfA (hemolysin III family)